MGAIITLRVFTVQLLGGRPEGSGAFTPLGESSYSNSQSSPSSVPSASDITEPIDDLPF